ncbi:hypothetical protein [Aeromonas bivalvium]|uniref:hypothetical protein n=1 Tax=Aeromonas bivalvium TaxID=440079 RepID=UPI0038CFB31B
MTEISRKTKQLATFCFSLFLIRLGFRAFGYDLLYYNPNDPYGIWSKIIGTSTILSKPWCDWLWLP